MARPKKEGLEYFPLDVYLDDKFKFIEIKFKLEGFAIVIKLLQKIYAHSYYIRWGEDEQLLFADEIRAELEKVRQVVVECLKRDIFSKTMYDKYKVLTSRGIQKRYMEATKKRTSVTIDKRFDLVFEEKTPVSEEKTPVKVTESTQSKVKESKVKESKVKREKTPCCNTENKKIYNCFENFGFGTVNLAIIEMIDADIEIFSKEWVVAAMKEAAKQNKYKYSYVEGILRNWKANGKENKKDDKYQQNVGEFAQEGEGEKLARRALEKYGDKLEDFECDF